MNRRRAKKLPEAERRKIAERLYKIADRIHAPKPVKIVQGKLLQFIPNGVNLGRSKYRVDSLRGAGTMGWIEWSNQWNRARFKAHPEGVFDQQCIAEIYAAMKGLR